MGKNLKSFLTALLLLPLISLSQAGDWEMDFDEDFAAASSVGRVDVQDYIGWGTDSLIGMWDGIRNAGAVLPHNPTSAEWVDLSAGGHNMTVQTGGSWGENCFVSDPNYYGTATLATNIENVMTIECVCVFNSAGPGRVAVQMDNRGSKSLDSGARWVARRKANTINFTAYGSYFAAPSVGVTATFSGVFSSSTSDTVAGYLNGVPQTITESGMYGLGDAVRGVSPYNIYRMDGKVYCIRVYNRALSSGEILANHKIDKIRFGLN